MVDYQEQPWSDNPNAPQMLYFMYQLEKAWFAGILLSLVSYGTRKISLPTHPLIRAHCFVCLVYLGMAVVLFFKCISALFDPTCCRGGEPIKWGLVSYVMIMFLLVTMHMAEKGHTLSISYINNCEFPDIDGVLRPGPYGYQLTINYQAIAVISKVAFNLNNWLADGLLVSSWFDVWVTRLGV